MASPLKTKALISLLALTTTVIPVAALACSMPPNPGTVEGSSGVPDQSVDPGSAPEPRPAYPDPLTDEISDRILGTVAAEVDRPANTLRIAATEPATWDGCMGLYEPNQACTMIAIFGLRLVVTDGDQSWVYHARHDGQGLVQNPTASGSRNGLIPDFIPPQPNAEPETEDYLFRSVESGSLAGSQREIVLLADGRLLHRENGRVVSERRLPAVEVAAFQQVLEDQRFPNLNRLRYLTDAAFADYPTVQLSTQYAQTHYIDLALDDAPPALQAVVQAWGELVAPAP